MLIVAFRNFVNTLKMKNVLYLNLESLFCIWLDIFLCKPLNVFCHLYLLSQLSSSLFTSSVQWHVLYVVDNRNFITVFDTDLAESINKKCLKGCGNGWSSSVGKARKSKHIREQFLCIYSQVSTDKRVKVQNVDRATCCACCINASDVSLCVGGNNISGYFS
jgi:hypothetical protein